jgi:hypothetical protein
MVSFPVVLVDEFTNGALAMADRFIRFHVDFLVFGVLPNPLAIGMQVAVPAPD